MNEYMVMQHNRVVKPGDKTYFLGDVTMGRNQKSLEILRRMNGEKVLIKGNHDLAPASYYLEHFKDIRACHVLDRMILTHIPVHTESLGRFPINVHGHLHSNRVMGAFGTKPDERYQSVCMEQLDDYTPISLEQLKARIKNLGLNKE
jgi:calcineurin-like phosphoesterase family protein